MIARALVAIFLMMNLCVAVWWAAGGPPAHEHHAPALAADVPSLTLLSESPWQATPAAATATATATAAPAPDVASVAGEATPAAETSTAETATAQTATPDVAQAAPATAAAAAPAVDERCYSLGPFRDRNDLVRVSAVLTPVVRRQQIRETEISEANGYQVLLPAFSDRAAAFAAAKALQTAGIRDYYVVTAGEQQNAISLGLFRDLNNAERRRDSVRAIGFDARLIPRQQQRSQWWLDIAVVGGDDWQSAIGKPDGWQIASLDCR